MDKKSKKQAVIVITSFLIIIAIFALFLIVLSIRKNKRKSQELPPLQISEIPVASNMERGADDYSEGNSEAEEEKVSKELTGEEENSFLLEFTPIAYSSIPEYSGEPYTVVNNGIPSFSNRDKENPTFEFYSELDDWGRCRVATANLSKELMPTEERGPMGYIKPTGWHTVKYPDLIGDVYLYNRCHLIAYSLAGENDNEKNLITGTRFLNVSGMLPFEREVAYYLETTGNHVLYRVNPIFLDDELVARGVQMEALSVEDNGQGICFNVFVYNVQPGIEIDYKTGDSWVIQ